jgi:hypothetical protein
VTRDSDKISAHQTALWPVTDESIEIVQYSCTLLLLFLALLKSETNTICWFSFTRLLYQARGCRCSILALIGLHIWQIEIQTCAWIWHCSLSAVQWGLGSVVSIYRWAKTQGGIYEHIARSPNLNLLPSQISTQLNSNFNLLQSSPEWMSEIDGCAPTDVPSLLYFWMGKWLLNKFSFFPNAPWTFSKITGHRHKYIPYNSPTLTRALWIARLRGRGHKILNLIDLHIWQIDIQTRTAARGSALAFCHYHFPSRAHGCSCLQST